MTYFFSYSSLHRHFMTEYSLRRERTKMWTEEKAQRYLRRVSWRKQAVRKFWVSVRNYVNDDDPSTNSYQLNSNSRRILRFVIVWDNSWMKELFFSRSYVVLLLFLPRKLDSVHVVLETSMIFKKRWRQTIRFIEAVGMLKSFHFFLAPRYLLTSSRYFFCLHSVDWLDVSR